MPRSKFGLGVEAVGEELRLVLVEATEGSCEVRGLLTLSAREDRARLTRSLPRRPGAVVGAVPLAEAAIRTLELPPTTEENLARVVALEAEAALPLPAEELALSHQVLGMTEQSRLQVLVAAARQRAVQALIGLTGNLPVGTPEVTVSSIALLNALHHLRGAGREGAVAILRIEERESEVTVVDHGRILTAQALPVGCGAPAPVPEGQPVPAVVGAEAEAVGLTALAGPAPPWVVSLCDQVRYVLQAVCYERGLRIERLYVCGSGAGAAGVDWGLSERLDLPVSLLAPPAASAAPDGAAGRKPEAGSPRAEAGVSASPLRSGADRGARYAVAYGCAVQALGLAAIPLNLTPARIAAAREIEERRQRGLSWVALGASLAVAGGLLFGAAVHSRQRAIAEVEARLQALRAEVALPAGDVPADLKTSAEAIDEALAVRVPPARLLSALSRHLPAGTWLAELSYNAETGCVIRGYSLDEGGAQRAYLALLRQGLFDEVSLDYRAAEKIGETPVWSFQLSCRLRSKGTTTRRGPTRR